MKVTIGTFNLNNLFSRYNFKGEIEAVRDEETGVGSNIIYQFGGDDRFKIRSYAGRLVKAKDELDTQKIAKRILTMDVDILAVQEVEDIDTLRHFNRSYLSNIYSNIALLEGNDPRLIDVGVLSKLPLGGITSWQQAIHPDAPERKVFGRDLLEVQVLNKTRTQKLFTLFNTHLKSHFVDFRQDPVAGEQASNLRRQQQAEIVAEIVKARTRPNSKFIVLGDMNDPPESPFLAPFSRNVDLNLFNGLVSPKETRPPKADTSPPSGPSWTHRFKPSGQPAQYELYDQIWLSPSLADNQTAAWIDRRTKHGGDGSDHDPAWIELDL